ncbi:hypothetical protein [Sulfurimonas sp.]
MSKKYTPKKKVKEENILDSIFTPEIRNLFKLKEPIQINSTGSKK